MITNARIGEYVGVAAWNKTTTDGGNIKAACDYAMTIPAGSEDPAELYPDIAAVASQYGDTDNKYTNFLANATGNGYVIDASFFWDQPLYDHGFAAALISSSNTSTGSGPSTTSGVKQTHSAATAATSGIHFWRVWGMLYGACMIVMATSFTEFL